LHENAWRRIDLAVAHEQAEDLRLILSESVEWPVECHFGRPVLSGGLNPAEMLPVRTASEGDSPRRFAGRQSSSSGKSCRVSSEAIAVIMPQLKEPSNER
jgi:hypothetical protein